ncbi:MAG: hypothetical protein AAF307_01520 [Pseudomonadota bacterium]
MHDGYSDWEVDRMGVAGAEFDQTLRCKSGQKAAGMLQPQIWSAIQDYLPVTTEGRVLSARKSFIETPELLLFGLSVVSRKVTDGFQSVLFTFQHAVGALTGVFAPSKAPNMLSNIEASLSTKTLEDIIRPALNLAATEPLEAFDNAKAPISAFIKKLRENQHEIHFYTVLLSRFLSRMSDAPAIEQRGQMPPIIIDTPVEHRA